MTVAATEELICCVDVFRKQTFCYLWLSEYENDDFQPLNSNRDSATQNRIKNAPNTYFMCNYFMVLLYSVSLCIVRLFANERCDDRRPRRWYQCCRAHKNYEPNTMAVVFYPGSKQANLSMTATTQSTHQPK